MKKGLWSQLDEKSVAGQNPNDPARLSVDCAINPRAAPLTVEFPGGTAYLACKHMLFNEGFGLDQMLPQNYRHRPGPGDPNHLARPHLLISLVHGMKRGRAQMVAAPCGSRAVHQGFA